MLVRPACHASRVQTAGLVLFIAVALGFDFTNGFHDAANAVAAAIATRSIRPATALGMAAGLNVLGAVVSTKVAATVGEGIIATEVGTHGLVIVFSALLGAIAWNLITWWFGLPSSSTHALIGGLVGAGLASSSTVHWSSLIDKVVVPMVLSPVVGFALGFLLMIAILWLFRRSRPTKVNMGFRRAAVVSTAASAFSHGTQDAQKTMGIIALALVATGRQTTFHVPMWVIISAAAAMGLGTLAGGWRVIRTLGSRITPLDPPRAFAAQTAASAVLLSSAYLYALPVSSTHIMTTSIMGVGASRRMSAVRWSVAQRVAAAWLMTIPGAAISAWLSYVVIHALV